MSKIHTYPKIFAVGSDFIPHLFKGEVEITEKIDGSQFDFGITKEGEIVIRSKGEEIFLQSCPKMFKKAVDFVDTIQAKLLELGNDIYFYGEFLGSPNHNILKYERTPKNNIMIFGVKKGESFVKDYQELKDWAERISLEVVPLLYRGEIKSFEEIEKLLETDSILGSEKIEGFVVKNYLSPCFLGNMVLPSFGKYVSERFKERHTSDWGSKFSGSSKLELFLSSFKTEARWEKVVQHLAEKGLLINEPKDIGILLKEFGDDLLGEEELAIKNGLYSLYKDEIIRRSRAGFPEWYKEKLARKLF